MAQHFKINRLPLDIGLSPIGRVVSTVQDIPLTTEAEHAFAASTAFPGSRSYPSHDLFGVRPVVSSIPSIRVTSDPLVVLTETEKDLVVGVYEECGDYMSALCDIAAALNGWDNCEEYLRAYAKMQIQATIGAALTWEVEAQIDPLLSFNGAVPAPCDFPWLTAPNPCSEQQMQGHVAASLTSQKHDWFYSPFVGFAGGGYLPITGIEYSPAPDVRELGSFSHHPAWDRHWLVIDRDGGLLLVSSRSSARIETHLPKEKPGKTLLCHFPPEDLSAAHTIAASGQGAAAHLGHGDTPGACAGWALARFDIRGGAATLDGIRTGPEPLWLPPLADAGGYTPSWPTAGTCPRPSRCTRPSSIPRA